MIEICKCDICGKQNTTFEIKYPVWFLTEQTEGRVVKPYISYEDIDLCEVCIKRVTPIKAHGAQGINKFFIEKEV